MSDENNDTSAAQGLTRRNGETLDRPIDIEAEPRTETDSRSQAPPATNDAVRIASEKQDVVVEGTRAPATIPATPTQNAPAPPKPIAPHPPTPQPLYPGHHPQPQYAPRPPPLHNAQSTPRPVYPNGQVPLPPPPPPSYVAYNQPQHPPVLMDRCPRCAFVPTLQYGQQPPPLPPHGSYLPSNFYSAPPNMRQQPPSQQPGPQQQYNHPPLPSSAAQRLPAPPASPRKPTYQVPPEFRSTRYWPGQGKPLPPAHIREHVSSLNAQVSSLPADSPPDYLPIDNNGHVLEPFIPPPKYAPVPTAEAVAALAPKWPIPGPANPTLEGESRRDKQKRVGSVRLTRDQRRDVLLMRRLGYQFESIARFLGATISSCHYTCRRGTPETNHKNGGRRVHIPPEIVTRMLEYVRDYQAKEKIAGRDKKTGKRKMPMLNWTMIRENCLADANGQIPKELKFTDDAMKKILNKHGVFLRKPMSEEMKEIGRLRGKKQWLDKLVKDRAEAARKAGEAQAAGQPVSAELAAIASGAMIPDGHGSDMDEGSDGAGDDAEMAGEGYSETDDTPVDSEEDDDDRQTDHRGHSHGQVRGHGHVHSDHQPMQIEDQLRQAMAAPGMYR